MQNIASKSAVILSLKTSTDVSKSGKLPKKVAAMFHKNHIFENKYLSLYPGTNLTCPK